MNIPKSIKIGGVNYEIQYIPDLNNGVEVLYGNINFEQSVIKLSSTIACSQQAQCITLLHEILHGIAEHAKLKIENEEHIVNVLSNGIFQVVQDNPDLFGCAEKH
jgi:hypothetical protein